jgi:hypothetical protein
MPRARPLLLCCVLGLGAGLALLGIKRLTTEPPNYTRIEDGLYVGAAVPQPPPGTTAVLNLCEREDSYQVPDHVWASIADSEPAPDLDWLEDMVKLVDGWQKEGKTTFIHCRNGVSRSGLVITAYEMFRHGWGREEALAFVRSRRDVVRPNPAFLKLLAEWEKKLQPPPAKESIR